jgi:hypothetical protein
MQQIVNRLNIVKLLQCAAIILTVLYVVAGLWSTVTTLMNAPFSMKLLMLNILGLALRLGANAFDVLVLLGLAEIIKMKQMGR